jgi:hypothetical protein
MPFPNPATQFKPGQSGNPGGRPKGSTLTRLLAEALEKDRLNDKEMKDAKKVAEVLVEAILQKAIEGDYRFVELVINRIDGKIPNSLTIDTHESTDFLRGFLLAEAQAADPAG